MVKIDTNSELVDNHSFSVVMMNKNNLKKISVSNEEKEKILFEGELGRYLKISLIENIMLEISGENGIIRIDLTLEELSKIFSKEK